MQKYLKVKEKSYNVTIQLYYSIDFADNDSITNAALAAFKTALARLNCTVSLKILMTVYFTLTQIQ